jgi:hypothetical protein
MVVKEWQPFICHVVRGGRHKQAKEIMCDEQLDAIESSMGSIKVLSFVIYYKQNCGNFSSPRALAFDSKWRLLSRR